MLADDDLPREARSGPIFHPDWGTHAYEKYRATITGLDALIAMVFAQDDESDKSRTELERRRQEINDRHSGPWAIDVGHVMLSWQTAMRVSAVEVFLQDALTFLAVYDEEFIRTRKSDQTWSYGEVRTASDNDDMLWTYCYRWARSFIGNGGPE